MDNSFWTLKEKYMVPGNLQPTQRELVMEMKEGLPRRRVNELRAKD